MSISKPLIVTGASGWFGRAALYEYEQMKGPEALRNDVVACASSHKEIDIGSSYGPIPAIPLTNLKDSPASSGILHLAFLTRDRLNVVGLDNYIKLNRQIISTVDSILKANPTIPAITTSSGAAAAVSNEKPVSVTDDPYAVLKLEEERMWKMNSDYRLSYVFRVFAASGRFMKEPRIFALGDFISQAVSGQRLAINSTHPVSRSYVNIGCLMRLCWSILLNPMGVGYAQIDACTHSISLHDLARLISSLWNLPEPYANINPGFPTDSYTGEIEPFRRLLNKYSIDVPSLEDQIRETSIDI